MASLHKNEKDVADQVVSENAGQQYELELTIKAGQKGNLYLAANDDLSSGLKISFDTKNGQLILDRSIAGQKVAVDYGENRTAPLQPDSDVKLNIYIDHSLIEIFVNDGENVLTGRYFADQAHSKIAFDKKINFNGKLWNMKTIL